MKDKKMLYGIGIVFLFLASVGFSYAYFTASIANKDVKDQVVTTGTLELTYTDGAEIKMLNIKPGQTITKKVTVKNTGTLDAAYNFVWQELNNTITNDEMVISATCKRLNGEVEEETCEGVDETPIKENVIKNKISIEPGITHEYNVTITFKEKNEDQNYNQGKSFDGVLGINEYIHTPRTLSNNYLKIAGFTNRYYLRSLTFYSDNRVIDGAKVYDVSEDQDNSVKLYVKTNEEDSTLSDLSIVADGIISFPEDSTRLLALGESANYGTATSSLIELNLNNSISTNNVTNMSYMFAYTPNLKNLDVTGINTSKVTDMNNMFNNCNAVIIGLDKFYTSKVTNMSGMFYNSDSLAPLDLSNFDTSKVTNMSEMFYSNGATSLNLSSFDTSKVTDMSRMFEACSAKSLDLSNFDTSNVTDMKWMFYGNGATTLNLSGFDTSKITDMERMFQDSQATTLDLSSFDTSNVTGMVLMFYNSKATSINLSSFNTSNVTSMGGMFNNSSVTELDLSSFDTSKVTSMYNLFYRCYDLKTIYVSNKFITTNVTDDYQMFTSSSNLVGGAGTVYDKTNVDKTYARIDGGTSNPGYFTLKNN